MIELVGMGGVVTDGVKPTEDLQIVADMNGMLIEPVGNDPDAYLADCVCLGGFCPHPDPPPSVVGVDPKLVTGALVMVW